MKQPAFVTFTGLDEKTDLHRVQTLSKRYPIEWGVLFGSEPGSKPRYPTGPFIESLEVLPVRKALHLCGNKARYFQELGDVSHEIGGNFDRVQVNMREHTYDNAALEKISLRSPFKIVLQHREGFFPEDPTFDYLYDTSGGRGLVPITVPKHDDDRLVGYAGGINPGNVADWLMKIDAFRFWIDMETGVRNSNDYLDLDACEEVCVSIWGSYGHQ